MRRKTVLSHLQQLFPTLPKRLAEASFFASLAAISLPAIAQNKSADAESAKTKKQLDATADENAPTVVSSEQISGRPERFIHFDYDVEVVKGSISLNANRAIYRFLDDEMEASGNVRMQRHGDCYSGDSVRLQLDSGVGYILHPYYLKYNYSERIDNSYKK